MITKKINFDLVDQILFYSTFLPDFVADTKVDYIKINQGIQEYIYLTNFSTQPTHVLDKAFQRKFIKFWCLGSLRPSFNFIYEISIPSIRI